MSFVLQPVSFEIRIKLCKKLCWLVEILKQVKLKMKKQSTGSRDRVTNFSLFIAFRLWWILIEIKHFYLCTFSEVAEKLVEFWDFHLHNMLMIFCHWALADMKANSICFACAYSVMFEYDLSIIQLCELKFTIILRFQYFYDLFKVVNIGVNSLLPWSKGSDLLFSQLSDSKYKLK